MPRPSAARVHVISTLRAAWEDVTAAGEVRREVWWPAGRRARPSHVFRATFRAELARAGVALEVRQALIAGARGSDRAYVGADALPLREAVAHVPAFAGRSSARSGGLCVTGGPERGS